MAHPIHRSARLGKCVMIDAGWYEASVAGPAPSILAGVRRPTRFLRGKGGYS